MNNNIKSILKELNNLSFPTVLVIESLDDRLLSLLGAYSMKDYFELPVEVSKCFEEGVNPDNLTPIYEILDCKKINSTTKKQLIMDITEVEGFNSSIFSLKICNDKNNTDKKNDIYNFINAFAYYKYLNPLLESLKDEESFKENFLNSINEIENFNNPIYQIINLFYIYNLISTMNSEKFEEIYFKGVMVLTKALTLTTIISTEKTFSIINNLKKVTDKKDELNEKISHFKCEVNLVKKENKKLENRLKEKNIKEKNNFLKEIKYEIYQSSKRIQDYNIDVLKRSYESIVKKNIQEISDVKTSLKLSENKVKSLEEELLKVKNSIDDNFVLDYIKTRIQNEIFIKNIYSVLKESDVNQIDIHNQCAITANLDCEKELIKTELTFEELYNSSVEIINKKNETTDDNSLIGYVSIIENKHYVNFSNGSKKEITCLPEKGFLGEGQFIVTNLMGEYKYSLKQYCTGDIPLNATLAIIKQEENKTIAYVNNNIIEIDNHMGFKIQDSVVGIIENNKIKKLFKTLIFNADFFIKSIKAKGFSAYYVVKSDINMATIRNIEDEKELNKQFNEYLKKDDILIVDNKFNVITIFNNIRFYINSSYYGQDKYGILSYKNGKAYFKDVDTTEVIPVLLPITLEEGTIIRIDEFNRYIDTVSEDEILIEKKERRNNRKNKIEKIVGKENLDIIGNVLIIGDIGLQHSYKLASLKKGYKATVLNGFECYNKVYKEARKADKIIIAEDFVDHNIMWEIKKKYDNVLFAKNSGANIIAEQLSKNIIGRKQMEILNN